ncbi:MAG: ASPIC/UnbV domain-containing protein [Verrucomicrobia bacterium]|nr:ASPIC/UnbV domain-containing protein [Verrucomicrobiota bacterium]
MSPYSVLNCVSNGGGEFTSPPEANFLYRNEESANAWLLVRLIGTVSNRSAIGAKVRVRATIRGQELGQLREISGGSGWSSQNNLRVDFGLGDATNVDLLRIEWPSGIVQEFRDLAARQILTVTEPLRLLPQ